MKTRVRDLCLRQLSAAAALCAGTVLLGFSSPAAAYADAISVGFIRVECKSYVDSLACPSNALQISLGSTVASTDGGSTSGGAHAEEAEIHQVDGELAWVAFARASASATGPDGSAWSTATAEGLLTFTNMSDAAIDVPIFFQVDWSLQANADGYYGASAASIQLDLSLDHSFAKSVAGLADSALLDGSLLEAYNIRKGGYVDAPVSDLDGDRGSQHVFMRLAAHESAVLKIDPSNAGVAPEPASIALLALGLAAVGLRRRQGR